MRTWVLAFFLLCCSVGSIAQQQGPLIYVTVPVFDSTAAGFMYKPQNYDPSKKYPLIIYHHGIGEAGGANKNIVNDLAGGLPYAIGTDAQYPENIVNPADGQSYSFFVLSLQNQTWAPPAQWIPYEVKYMKEHFSIDTTRIYLTGISSGAETAFKATMTSDSVSRLLAAVVPLSTVDLHDSYDSTLLRKYKTPLWLMVGNQDTFQHYTIEYTAMANRQSPGIARYSMWNGGHSTWDSIYHINHIDPTYNMSIYQWMLTNQRNFAANAPLPVKFTNFQVTDLGNKTIRVDFTYSDAEGIESFYIRLWVNKIPRDILITPQDKVAPNKYSKTINVNQ
jgi:poly(3-hydroxybutyrate) depolymerase